MKPKKFLGFDIYGEKGEEYIIVRRHRVSIGLFALAFKRTRMYLSSYQFLITIAIYLMIASFYDTIIMVVLSLFLLPVLVYVDLKWVLPSESQAGFLKNPEWRKLKKMMEENNEMLKKLSKK